MDMLLQQEVIGSRYFLCKDSFEEIFARNQRLFSRTFEPPEGGILPNIGYIGMCRGEGYGFQAVYCEVGYINCWLN